MRIRDMRTVVNPIMTRVSGVYLLTFGVLLAQTTDTSAAGNSLPSNPSELFPHHAELDEKGNYFLFWKFDEETITFEVHAKTHGWVGFGLSDNGAMRGADIVVCWINNGNTSFTDGTVRVIYAWGDTKPQGQESFGYHGTGNRGARSLLLRKYTDAAPNNNVQNMEFFTLTVTDVKLPAKQTYYHCRIFALPDLKGKHHITKIKPKITKGNEGAVHHIIIHFCDGAVAAEPNGRDCWTDDMPDAAQCGTMAYAWGIGGDDYYFPEKAGLSIGGQSDARFYELEIHYDNPQLLTSIVDSSGFDFYYTKQLRENDVGILILGHSISFPPMIIPPKAKDFRLDTYCGRECTKRIPKGGINIFGTFPHTHLSGTRIFTKHVRDGKELREIVRDDHYDFNYQIQRTLKEHRIVYPGGLGTKDEMCLNFLLYYPKINLDSCLSDRPIREVMKYFVKTDWREFDAKEIQSQFDNSQNFRQTCAHSGQPLFSGQTSTTEARVKINKPHEKTGTCAGGARDPATGVILAVVWMLLSSLVLI